MATSPKNNYLSKEWLMSRILKVLAKSGYEPKEYSFESGVTSIKNT